MLRRSETLQSLLGWYKYTRSQLADISSGRFCPIEGGVGGHSIGSGLSPSCTLLCITFKCGTGNNLTSTCVTTSVACESCCESTATARDAKSSVFWDSTISTSCDSEVSGSVARTSSDGTAPPLLRARFVVFSGAGTAGRPNNVDCFVLSLLGPRPFAAPAVATHTAFEINQKHISRHNIPFHLPVSAASALSKKLSLLCRDLLFGLFRANGLREPSAASLGFFANGFAPIRGG